MVFIRGRRNGRVLYRGRSGKWRASRMRSRRFVGGKVSRKWYTRPKGNRARSGHVQHRKFGRRFRGRRFGMNTQTVTYTNNHSIIAPPLVDINKLWVTDATTSMNIQSTLNAVLPVAANQPYKYLFKQWRVKKIITYVRFIDAPQVFESGQDWIAAPAGTAPANNAGGKKFMIPIHWEMFYRANNQADPPVTDEMKYDFNKVGITGNGKQYKFSVVPMANYLLQTLDPDTKEVVSGTNVKYYKPSGWIDMNDPATEYKYKVADVLNHSHYQVTPNITNVTNNVFQSVNGILEASFSFVIQYRWRKNKSIIDATGGNDPIPIDVQRLNSDPAGPLLLLNSPAEGPSP